VSVTRLARALAYVVLVAVGLVGLTLATFSVQAGRREVHARVDGAPPTGRFVSAGDVEVFVQEAGPPAGPAVLFVHGTGAWSETWRESMTALAATGYRAIAIDLPPFGYSQRPDRPRYGKREQGQRIVAVVDALQIPRVILVLDGVGHIPQIEAPPRFNDLLLKVMDGLRRRIARSAGAPTCRRQVPAG
jgi:alpha/beta hydrolase fold